MWWGPCVGSCIGLGLGHVVHDRAHTCAWGGTRRGGVSRVCTYKCREVCLLRSSLVQVCTSCVLCVIGGQIMACVYAS